MQESRPLQTATTEKVAVRRGRPLNESLNSCILVATLELLAEVGYDKITVKDIADRAGAGLGAIYRRWPTKVSLIVAALGSEDDDGSTREPTGDPTKDLSRVLIATVHRMERRIPGFVGAMQRDPELATAVREAIVAPKQRELISILSSVFADPSECALRAELALALPLHRLILGLAPPSKHEIRTRLVPVLLAQP